MAARFTDEGLSMFGKWIKAGARGAVPAELLTHPAFATPLPNVQSLAESQFEDRFAFGEYLAGLLAPLDQRSISYDRHLWSWLAAHFFEQICPATAGERNIRRDYVYILDISRKAYRHLVRTPWYLVSTHGAQCRYLLTARPGDPAPLSRQRGLLETLAARQSLISSPTLIASAGLLYADRHTGQPRRGIDSLKGGSPDRLALIANQLALTFDIHDMQVQRFLELLPEEFGARRVIRNAQTMPG